MLYLAYQHSENQCAVRIFEWDFGAGQECQCVLDNLDTCSDASQAQPLLAAGLVVIVRKFPNSAHVLGRNY